MDCFVEENECFMNKEKNIGCITMEKFDIRDYNSVGSSRIRIRWLLPYWEEAEEYIIGKKYDVIIFQKVYWDTFKNKSNYKGVKILDLCDPDWLENKPVFEYVDWVDAVTTSTEPLAEFVRKLRPNKIVKCIPDRVYLPEAIPIKTKHSPSLKRLAWFGYYHNFYYLYSTFDELIKRGIELITISNAECEAPTVYRNKLKITHIPYSYDTVNREIIKADAVLMPETKTNERGKYKSNNKTLQAWSLGMPVIKVPEDLDRLMSKEAREKESREKRKEIEEKWDVQSSVAEYQELINNIIKEKKNG